jgi:hypothetical protein
MAQANALIGIETAAYYPTLSLTAGGGVPSLSIAQLFSLPVLFWSLRASAAQTIFDAGLRNATVAQYTATYNADVVAYKQTVLTVFQQVEDYIPTLRVTSRQIAKQEEAEQTVQQYLDIATSRYETGLDPYLNVVTAQTTLLGNQQTLITLRVSEMMSPSVPCGAAVETAASSLWMSPWRTRRPAWIRRRFLVDSEREMACIILAEGHRCSNPTPRSPDALKTCAR